MALFFSTGVIAFPIGTGAFLGAFFDTVAVRLESGRRGSRLPALAALYADGELSHGRASAALAELDLVRAELARFTPDQVVWDADDPAAQPPWGENIAPTISSLANWFVTSDGRPMLDVLASALDASSRIGQPLRIR
ncbi:Imm70 family immunity protein [Nocardioides kongjuensis]|uniref:Uncharacterized protein n=1 Tax=Nocardioides kongjuensis TaxID=349522 RepID=A0A852RU26_9ACTN|nr:hypothetical protein [Nocardioides kongjuensis]